MKEPAGRPVFDGAIDEILAEKIVDHSRATATEPGGKNRESTSALTSARYHPALVRLVAGAVVVFVLASVAGRLVRSLGKKKIRDQVKR